MRLRPQQIRGASLIVSAVPLWLVVVPATTRADSILRCKLRHDNVQSWNGRDVETQGGKSEDAEEFVFAGLDSDAPVYKGAGGEEKLRILRREPEALWLVEYPPLGGVNVWTIFLKERVVVVTKSYAVLGKKPLGVLGMGTCK